MSRRAHAKPTGIQMFPFLAVLICTMGALVVLLHAFARHGQVQAIKIAESRTLQINVEDVRWRIGHLRAARAKTEAELADERLKLAHVEDHHRRLQEKLRQLELAAAQLKCDDAQTDPQKLADEIAAVKADLAAARAALEEARRGGRNRPASYSVVPYEGRNSTRRRPIYIECRENSIVLQPESIELNPRDFAGSFAPSNPLAAAVRAQREYFARAAGDGPMAEEPYPLLLVRPEGVVMYYAARAALDSWGSDFGYELIGSDWTLTFSDPDPQLASLTRKVVDEARQRHRQYASTSPRAAGRVTRPVYRARAHGGFAPEGGAGGAAALGRKGMWDDWPGGGGDGFGGQGEGFVGGDSSSAGGRQPLEDPYGDAADGTGTGPDDLAAGAHGPDSEFGQDGGPGTRSAASGQDGGPAATPAVGNAAMAGASSENSSRAGASGHGQDSGAQASVGSQPAGSADAAGGSCPPSGAPHATASHSSHSMAAVRGRNWGLPESSAQAVAATRPILIDCYADRLVVVPESRTQAVREIRLTGEARESMDELVSSVWEHMKVWGKAGKGLYWRPTLYFDVRPGAEGRFAEIEGLLADSGLDVERRQPRTAAGAPPRTTTRRPLRK